MTQPEPDETLLALHELDRAIEQVVDDLTSARGRISDLVAARRRGGRWRDIVESEARPLIVETLSSSLDRLAAAGARVRRAEAAVLHAEGLSMERIAALFGVTRQRVGALLKAPSARGMHADAGRQRRAS